MAGRVLGGHGVMLTILANTVTSCPILVYITVPPLPHGTYPQELERYDQEVSDPSGIRFSLPKPPNYWDVTSGVGLGGVIVADQCGVVVGFEGGKGIRIDDFWKKSVNCESSPTLLPSSFSLLLLRLSIWAIRAMKMGIVQANAGVRCDIRDNPPAHPSTTSRQTDGIDPNAIFTLQSLTLDHCDHGHNGLVDL